MSMRAIRLDFVRGHAAASAWRWVLLGAGVAVLVLALLEFADIRSTHALARKAHAEAEQAQARNRPAPPDPREAAALAERAKAANPYIRLLNLNWGGLLKALEPPSGLPVRLLGIDTTSAAGKLRIAAQADNADGMADYVSVLAGRSGLLDVYLVRHELQNEGNYRFEVEAIWIAGR